MKTGDDTIHLKIHFKYEKIPLYQTDPSGKIF